MRTILHAAFGLLLLATPAAAQGQDQNQDQLLEPTAGTTGSLELGFLNSSLSGSPDFVSRYLPADVSRPAARFELESHPEWGNVRLSLDGQHENNQKHSLIFDIGRVLRSTTTYTRYTPRLGHDPMTNLEAATTHGRVVRYSDLDPTRAYELTNALLEHRTEIQPSGLSALTLGLGYRDQRRDGFHQTMAISHCDTCHVVSQSHPIEERLREGTLDATLSWLNGFVKGSFTRRELRQGTAAVDVLYDRALHPELRTPLFDNRVQFDALDGPQAVDHLQDSNKNIARAQLHVSDLAGFALAAGGVWSGTKNHFTGLQADYQGYSFSAARRFKKKLNLRFRGRAYFLDNDDFFVASTERLGTAGPQAGQTYQEIYGFDPSFLRQSSLNRDVYETNLDVTYKLGKKAGKIKALWRFRSIDRQHYEVAPGVNKTTTHVLGLSWRPRPAKGLRVIADYRHGSVDNPFMLLDGACSNLVSPGPLPSPFAPQAAQYFEFHDARVADTTASPQSWNEIRLRSTYTRGPTSFSGNYRWWEGSNDAGDLTDWSRKNQSAGATLWTMPSEKWEWYVAYTWQKLDLGNPTCVPLFDG